MTVEPFFKPGEAHTRTHKDALRKQRFRDYTPAEMSAFIESMADTDSKREEMYYGIAFMKNVLKRDGVTGIIAYVEEISTILLKDGKLLKYDFEDDAKVQETQSILQKTKLKPNRRDFMRTSTWAFGGIVSYIVGAAQLTHGIVKTGFEIKEAIEDRAPAQEPADQNTRKDRNALERFDELFNKYALGPAEIAILGPGELMIGMGLRAEGKEKTEEIKREQVANIVAEMADKMNMRPQSMQL